MMPEGSREVDRLDLPRRAVLEGRPAHVLDEDLAQLREDDGHLGGNKRHAFLLLDMASDSREGKLVGGLGLSLGYSPGRRLLPTSRSFRGVMWLRRR